MAKVIRVEGNEVVLQDSKEVRKQALIGEFDGIIVGGSVHAGNHQSSLREFVKRNRELLDKSAFSILLS
jgi:menaquinone-dependent protoporphyrinogen oxidase